MRESESDQRDAPVTCRFCNKSVPQVYRYCPECGSKFGDSEPPLNSGLVDRRQARGRKNWLRIIAVACVCILGMLTLYAFYIEPNLAVEERLSIRVQNLPKQLDGFRIVHLSDLHVVRVGRRENAAIRIVNRAKADMLVVTGDFAGNSTGGRNEIGERACVTMLTSMKTRYGIYGALGSWDLDPIIRKLAAVGIPVLMDRTKVVWVRGQPLAIVGLRHDTLNLRAALSGSPSSAVKVVICEHLSATLEKELPKAGVALVLTGARHGGQIRLPVISRFYGADHCIGLRRNGTTWHYANRGLGTSRFSARFLCPPEVTVITLRCGNKS